MASALKGRQKCARFVPHISLIDDYPAPRYAAPVRSPLQGELCGVFPGLKAWAVLLRHFMASFSRAATIIPSLPDAPLRSQFRKQLFALFRNDRVLPLFGLERVDDPKEPENEAGEFQNPGKQKIERVDNRDMEEDHT